MTHLSLLAVLMGFDIRIDYMLQDDNTVKYDIFSNSMGTATREAGAYLRNDILNVITRTKTGIVLDFAGVKTVSSSSSMNSLQNLFCVWESWGSIR